MTNQFTAISERDEKWCIAYCPEIPGHTRRKKLTPVWCTRSPWSRKVEGKTR
jgi:hypothetical protein